MSDYLAAALNTEVFLSHNQLETDAGITWRRVPGGKPTHSFYHGSAGTLVYYLELFNATNDVRFLEIAGRAGDEVLAYVNKKVLEEAYVTIGFHSGWPGYIYVLNELYKASGEPRYRDGAIAALNRMTAQSSDLGAGIGWIEPIPFSDITGIEGEREIIDLSVGAAGAGVIYLYAHREGLSEDALALAVKTADRLLELGESTDDGLRWLMMADMPFPFTAPNFAHGGAGVGYYLADLYRETGNQAYLEAALSAAAYIKTRTYDQSDGFLVCHTEEQQPPSTFYLGVCHGPAGTGRFMSLLHQITGDAGWWTWLSDNFRGLLSTGAPEERSKGLWQNLGQCCGDAGIGDYALFLYQESGDTGYLEFARRVGDHMIAHGEGDQGLSWEQAEHRSRPEFTEVQTGYMQGAAGIGSFLLHLDTVLEGSPGKLITPEMPFRYTG
jgi:lantibiotic modifying enzyme